MLNSHEKFYTQNGKRQLLITDDEFINREILGNILEDDYSLLFAENGAEALEKNDLDAAFTLAHTLKGVYGNLALTPLFEIVNEMTELLRARTQTDYSAMTSALIEKKNALKALCE